MNHRRRGADFSDLLQSFNATTDCRSDLDPTSSVSQPTTNISSDAYDGNRKISSMNSTDTTGSFKSTILAGHIADSESQGSSENSYQTARSGSVAGAMRSSSGSDWRTDPPSLMNRAMDFRFEPESDLELTRSTEPRCSGELNRNINSLEKTLDKPRDTNFNIKNSSNKDFSTQNVTEPCQGINSPALATRDPFTFLSRLDNILDPHGDKTSKSKDTIVRRLSQEFMYSPRTFTERLVTIMDVSETDNPLDGADTSGVNLSRMTKEFRKMCKFIQDESMPEWAPSVCENSLLRNSKYQEEKKFAKVSRPETIAEMPSSSSSCDVKTPRCDDIVSKKIYRKTPLNIFKNALRENRVVSPGSPGSPNSTKYFEKLEKLVESSPRNPKSPLRNLRRSFSSSDISESSRDKPSTKGKERCRKTPLNIFKNIYQENPSIGSPGSPNSTKDFENLEKFVNSLPNSPKSASKNLRRSLSAPKISTPSRDTLTDKCAELLRSLDDTNPQEFNTFDSHQTQGNRENIREDEPVELDSNVVVKNFSDFCNQFDEDELSTSLLIEWRKKRQRCFETAMKMQEIEIEAKKTNEEYPEALTRHGIDPNVEFMKTVTTCYAYQNCVQGLRKKENSKRTEGSSADSGIDTRSLSRIHHASGKKLDDTKAATKKPNRTRETFPKNQRSEGLLSSRWKNTRVETGATKKIIQKPTTSGKTSNLGKPISGRSPRKTSPNFLCPRKIPLGRSRSPSQEKRSPARQVSAMRKLRTPEPKQNKDIRVKTIVPKIQYVSSSPEIIEVSVSNSASEEEQIISGNISTPKSATRSAKSPRHTYRLLSPKVSPLVRIPSKERVAKVLTYEGQRSADNSPRSMKPVNSPQRKVFNTPGKPVNSPQRKFFITPGKAAPISSKKKKTFFSNIDNNVNKEASQRIMKSLHAPGLYRLGYQTVISPVSMYIHGTDMNLIQNNPENKNDMLLTPTKATESEEKLKYKLSGKSSTPRKNARKQRFLHDQEEDSDSQPDANDENIEEPGFALPKAMYELPAQVYTVKESPTYNRGARTRGLLQSMQNRIVIRHEGKRHGMNDDNRVPESGSDSADMSIHVQKLAEKTNYMSHWK